MIKRKPPGSEDDKLQFALGNSKLRELAFSQRSLLTYETKKKDEIHNLNSLPLCTATEVKLNFEVDSTDVYKFVLNRNQIQQLYIQAVSPQIEQLMNLAKLSVKSNIIIKIVENSKRDIYDELVDMYKNKQVANDTTEKRKFVDTEMIEVPLDKTKRMKFLSSALNDLIQSPITAAAQDNHKFPHDKIVEVLNYDKSCYREYDEKRFSSLINSPTTNLTDIQLDNHILHIASIFIDSVVVFNDKLSVCITSLDVFYQNNRIVDDCAVGLDRHDHHSIPTAKLISNTYLQSAKYYELSIFIGMFELLVTGGYVVLNNSNKIKPFLGSSIDVDDIGEITSTSLLITPTKDQSDVIFSPRLLNQYKKRSSHKL